MEMYTFSFYESREDTRLLGKNYTGKSIDNCFKQFRKEYPLGFILHIINKTDK